MLKAVVVVGKACQTHGRNREHTFSCVRVFIFGKFILL